MTPDGAWVAFISDATNLVTGIADVNRLTDVFLHEVAGGKTRLLSKHFQQGKPFFRKVELICRRIIHQLHYPF